MIDRYSIAFYLVLSWTVGVLDASAGDADPRYRVEHESLCFNGSHSTSHLGNLGWCNSSSFSLEVVVVIGDGIAMLLEIYDFPLYRGFFDAYAIWHATTIPLTYLWWSFIRDDAEFRRPYQ